MRSYVPLLGRVLLGLIFVMSGLTKITGFEATQQQMAAQGMPLTAVFLVGAIAVEVLGGLSVILGLWARVGAAALFLFLIPATLIVHTDFSQQTQLIMFLKNLSIMGGLLLVTTFGSGPYRIRALPGADRNAAHA
ncbi:MAG: DoxX family protein [Salinibacter sp.]